MFWDNYCKLCSERNLKPNNVASEIGVSSAAVTKWKNGTIPGGEILMAIADFFDCSLDTLLGRTVESNNVAVNSPQSVQGCSNSVNFAAKTQQTDSLVDEMIAKFNGLPFSSKVNVLNMIEQESAKNEQA